jgi:hypothetical protein
MTVDLGRSEVSGKGLPLASIAALQARFGDSENAVVRSYQL